MKKSFLLIPFVFSVFFFACNQKLEEPPNASPSKNIQTNVVPKDSRAFPKDILVDENELLKTSIFKTTTVLANANISFVNKLKIILAGTPRISIEGKDTFLLPIMIPAIDSPFFADIPEIVVVKDAYAKDQNPQNFSSFSKLQGIKSSIINCLLQDKVGNIWLGTGGKGVTKYDGKCFTTYTEKEGLGNNEVLCMLEDHLGNLWFGAYQGGVTKYDGKKFTRYSVKEGLCNNDVFSIMEDHYGNLWFGTGGGGVSKYDGNRIDAINQEDKNANPFGLKKNNGKFVKCFSTYSEKEGLCNNFVNSIIEDRKGNIWFGTSYGGVSKYDGNRIDAIESGDKLGLQNQKDLLKVNGKFVKTFKHFTKKEGLCSNYIECMLEDKKGNIWFGFNGNGVSKYDGTNFIQFNENEKIALDCIRSIMEDENGQIWFGSEFFGAWKFSALSEGKQTKYFLNHYDESEGLSSNVVRNILQDRSGNIWFGTSGGGLSKYDGKIFTHLKEREGFPKNLVQNIIKDNKGDLWFASRNEGVTKFDGKSITHFTISELSNYNDIICLAEDRKGNICMGTNGGGLLKFDGKTFTHFDESKGLCNNAIRCILVDRFGNIWMGTSDGLSKYDGKSVVNYRMEEGLSSNIILSLMEDKSGNIWIGTYGGGVCKFDGHKFIHLSIKEGLSNDDIWALLEDDFGNMWFGTGGGGVTKFDGSYFTTLTEKDGLSDNYVTSMLKDMNGNLWLGTTSGLNEITKAKQNMITKKIKKNYSDYSEPIFKNYKFEDGFLGNGCNGQAICEDENGNIWIGANDRLTVFHPDGDRKDSIAPNIQLTNLNLFNENVSWIDLKKSFYKSIVLGNGVTLSNYEFDGISQWYSLPENLSLAYNNNYLTFNFIGITQKQPKKVKYQYKLEGIDENWSAITKRTEAPYGNIPDGNYTFKVKAMNSEGYWSKEFNYKFTIRPPWWKTWWFRTFLFLSVIVSISYYIKRREKKLVTEKEILEKTVVERTAEISEQKDLIEEKHKEITDSINYAERIQRSFLATTELLDENLKDHFIFFQPKDVVSGDFYWANKLSNGDFALITADSTGHGVPGAIMSLLNITSIESSVKDGLVEPSDILNSTRKTIIERLKKDGSSEGGKDGMDASLICFDFKNNTLTYSAANNPIWIARGNQLLEFAPDKMPIGKHDKDSISFTQHEVSLQKGDVVYALTDGMPDQFGGPKGKKFMYKQLKELLISISNKPMEIQKQKLSDALNNWKGYIEQVDDITLIGVRI